MPSSVHSLFKSSGFCPRLREDVRFYRGKKPNIVVIHDLASDRRFQIYEVESVVARHMDGHNDLDALTKIARRGMPSATREQVEKLAIQVAGMGLLANIPTAEPPAPDSSRTQTAPPRLSVIEGGQKVQPPPFSKKPISLPSFTSNHSYDPSDDDDDDDDDADAETFVDPNVSVAHGPSGTIVESPEELFQRISELGPPPKDVGLAQTQRAEAAPHRHPRPGTLVGQQVPQPSQPAIQVPVPVQAPAPDPFAPVAAEHAGTQNAAPLSRAERPAVQQPGGQPTGAQDDRAEARQKPSQPSAPASPQGFVPPAPTPSAPAPAVHVSAADQGGDWEIEKPPLFKRKSVRRLAVLGTLALIIAALAIIQWPLYITELCVVRPKSQVVVRAPIDGIVAEVFVGEGDDVKKGDTLVRLDDRELSHELRRAKADYDRLQATLEKMRSGSRPEEIRSAKALVSQKAQDAAYARRESRRVSRLFKSGDASGAERDAARRDHRVKAAAAREARAQLKLVQAGFRSEEVQIAEANLRKAEADMNYFEKQLEMLVIKAPIAGRVLTPRFRERLHEKIPAGAPIVEVGDASVVRVEIMVDERDADVIAIGQPVTLKVHSFPLRPFVGSVSFIAPAVEEKDGRRFIRVDAVIDNPDGTLQPRMTGYGEINAGSRSVLNRISRRAIRWVRVRFLI